MTTFTYHVSLLHPFDDDEGTELPDDTAALREALLTVRNIENCLGSDGCWTLEVRREDAITFQIAIQATTTIANL